MKKAATCVMQIAANCFMIIYYLKTYSLSTLLLSNKFCA